MADHRVGDDRAQGGGDGGGLGGKRTGVDGERVVADAGGRDELIHDAAGRADVVVFGTLAGEGDVGLGQGKAGERQERGGGGDLNGGGGTEAGTQRNVSRECEVGTVGEEGGNGLGVGWVLGLRQGSAQTPGYAEAVAAPMVAFGEPAGVCEFGEGDLSGLVEVERMKAEAVVGAEGGGDEGIEAEGGGHAEAAAVVGVFAEQIDTAGGLEDADGLAGRVGLVSCDEFVKAMAHA